MRRLLPLSVCCLFAAAPVAHAADLAVTVTGVQADRGDVRIVVIADPDGLPRQLFSRNLRAGNARTGAIETHFLGVVPGLYEVVAMHDAHVNHSFEKAMTGTVKDPEAATSVQRVTVAEPAVALSIALR